MLVSTQTKKPFPTIPEPRLIAALKARSGARLVESDSKGGLPKGFARGPFWIDYRVKATRSPETRTGRSWSPPAVASTIRTRRFFGLKPSAGAPQEAW